MADLTGYTAMTDVHGSESAAKIVRKYMEIVDKATHGTAHVMQRIGDQVVIIADSAHDLLQTAKNLSTLTREEHHFLSVHAGLHFGKILIENNNLFGTTINVASRIMHIACSGQILCSSAFLDQISQNYETLFRSIGTHKLKNVINDIELFELMYECRDVHIDPVCHMHIDPEKQSYTAEHSGSVYYFCSEHCKSLFLTMPEQFIIVSS